MLHVFIPLAYVFVALDARENTLVHSPVWLEFAFYDWGSLFYCEKFIASQSYVYGLIKECTQLQKSNKASSQIKVCWISKLLSYFINKHYLHNGHSWVFRVKSSKPTGLFQCGLQSQGWRASLRSHGNATARASSPSQTFAAAARLCAPIIKSNVNITIPKYEISRCLSII